MQVKKIIYCFLISLFMVSNAYSNNSFPEPLVQFSEQNYMGKPHYMSVADFDKRGESSGNSDSNIFPDSSIDVGVFPLLLGYELEEIKEYLITGGIGREYDEQGNEYSLPFQEKYKFNTLKINKNVSVLKAQFIGSYVPLKGFYILKNNRSVGIIFFNALRVISPKSSDYFQGISQLNMGSSPYPLSRPSKLDRIQANKRKRINYYHAKRNDNYIESYAVIDSEFIVRNKNKDVKNIILFQAFYPKQYKEHLKKFLEKKVIIEYIDISKAMRQ